MTINANNFTSASLSGPVQVRNSYANVTLQTVPFAFEGDKSFIIRLRRNSTEGDIIATTPTVTIKDNAALVSFVANNYSTAEGDLVEFTLTTINAANNVLLYYSTEAITANVHPEDFIGANIGSFLLVDNIGKIILHANVDGSIVDETGEAFKLQIRTGSVEGNVVLTSDNVFILDTSNVSTYILSQSVTNLIEGGTVSFDINTINVPANTEIYYTTVGNATTQNFVTGNTGTLIVTDNFANINLATTEVIPEGESRSFSLQIRENSLTGPIKATSEIITISDSSSAFIQAEGGQEFWQDGYKIHVFTTSRDFFITGLPSDSFPENKVLEYVVVAGGGGGGPPNNNEYGNPGSGAGGLLLGNINLSNTQTYSIVIGAGSAGGASPPSTGGAHPKGANTTAFGLIALGGGGGGYYNSGFFNPSQQWQEWTGVTGPFSSGGSGAGTAGLGIRSPADGYQGANLSIHGRGTIGQGNPGGYANAFLARSPFNQHRAGAGGGGAGQAGGDAVSTGGPPGSYAGYGGNGISIPWITPALGGVSTANFGQAGPGTGRWFAGGGGGANYNEPPASPIQPIIGPPIEPGSGGLGGGGAGGFSSPASFGLTNTGGGGGGRGLPNAPATTGGSGIVIVRYPYTRSDYKIVDSSNTLLNSSNIRFTISTLNVANNTVLYYDTVGNVTTDNFIQGNNGTVTAVVGRFSNIDLTVTGIPENEERHFNLQLRTGSSSGPVVKTSNNILILGDNLAYMNAEGGEIYYDGQYKVHRFYEPGSLQITQGGAWFNRALDYYIVGGGGSAEANTYTPTGQPGTFADGSSGAMTDAGARGAGGGGHVHTGTIGVTQQTIPVLVGVGGLAAVAVTSPITRSGGQSNIFLSQYPAPINGTGRLTALGGGQGATTGSPSYATGGNSGRNINGSFIPVPPQFGADGGSGAGGASIGGQSSFGGNGFVNSWFQSNIFFGGGGAGTSALRVVNWIANGNAIVAAGGARGLGMPAIRGTGGGGSGSPRIVGDGGNGAPGTVILRYRQPLKQYRNLLENSRIHFANSNIVLTLNTFNVSNSTILYYDTVGNVTTNNFVQGNTGTVSVAGNAAILTLTTLSVIPDTEYRQFHVRMRENSAEGTIVSISNTIIIAGGL